MSARAKAFIAIGLIVLAFLAGQAMATTQPPPPPREPHEPPDATPGNVLLTGFDGSSFFVSANSSTPYKVWVNGTDWRDQGYWLLRGLNSRAHWVWYPMNSVNFEFQVSWNDGDGQVGFYNYIGYNFNDSWPIHVSVLENTSSLVVVQTTVGSPYITIHQIGGPHSETFNMTQTWYYYPWGYVVNKQYYFPSNSTCGCAYTNAVSAIEGSGNNPAWFGYDLGKSKSMNSVIGMLPSGHINVVTTTGPGETHLTKESLFPYTTPWTAYVNGTAVTEPPNLPYSVTLFNPSRGITETVSEILLNYNWQPNPKNEGVDWTITQNSYDRAELSVPWTTWLDGSITTPSAKSYTYAMIFGEDGGTLNDTEVVNDILPIQQSLAGWVPPQT